MTSETAFEALTILIHQAEPSVSKDRIWQVVTETIPRRPQALRLLASLEENSSLLTSGSDTVPRCLEKIIGILVNDGATQLRLPRCFICGRVWPLTGRIGIHRICDSCYIRRHNVFVECSQCRQMRRRHVVVVGSGWCCRCWTEQLTMGFQFLCAAVIANNENVTEPQAEAAVQIAFHESAPGVVLRLALELAVVGADWFANPAAGTLPFLKLHAALAECGVRLVPAVCGYCGLVARLDSTMEGLRCCFRCRYNRRRTKCSGCGMDHVLYRRQADGSGLCQMCTKRLPDESVICIVCQRSRIAAWTGPDGPVCSICRPRQLIDFCPICKRQKPCLFAGTPKAQCHECSKRQERCGLCGKIGQISTRDRAGTAICKPCARRPETCTDCQRFRVVVGRLNGKPLCDYCYQRNPVSFRDCLRCGKHQHLFETGLCDRCTADDKIELFIPPALRDSNEVARAVYEVCRKASARTILKATRNSSTKLLSTMMSSDDSLSHEFLDQAGSQESTRPVRSLLVDAGLLPPRDDTLARFEQWIATTAEQLPDPKDKAVFLQFARWRHLRQLRKRPFPISLAVAGVRREELRLVVELLEWMRRLGRQLDSLNQSDIDRWCSLGAAGRYTIRPFLQWAHSNGLVCVINVITPPRTALGVVGTTDTERFRLLNSILDPECAVPASTRFCAALVLLFGARPQQISRLRVSDIAVSGSDVYLRLGTDPVLLPEVLVELAIATCENRRAPRMFAPTIDNEWLFPGSKSGYPLGAAAINHRLRRVGVSASKGRTGAMASLAQDLPPTILARLTGTSPSTAIRWSVAVAACNARYAAFAIQQVP